MIIENKTTEKGDVLHISTDVPVLGLVLLSGFIDNTSSMDPGVYFQKKIRYSKDVGATWSSWMDLTNENLQAIPIAEKEMFLFEYAYQHEGSDGDLYFNWVQLSGQVRSGDDVIFQKTDFSQFFQVNDIGVLGWAFNVLEKLYERGILPKYIQRDYTENSADFIAYWLSITHFFAIIVYMARQYLSIRPDAGMTRTILCDAFLESRGAVLSGNETTAEKQWIFDNYLNDYRKRGTNAIIGQDEESGVYGEFLRLIGYIPTDEFMFFPLVRQDLGWCLDCSSPMWNYTETIVNAIKAFEKTLDFSIGDITKYPTVGNGTIVELPNKAGETENWYQFDNTTGAESGITAGDATTSQDARDKLLKISPATSYEISFRVMTDNEEGLNNNLKFGIQGYSIEYGELHCVDAVSGDDRDLFINPEETPKFIYLANQPYWIRGILLSADTHLGDERFLNFLNGVPLRLHKDMKYITPVITRVGSANQGNLYINDIKIRPLELSVERGYLGSTMPIVSYFYNNSGRSEEYIKQFTENYLLSFKNNILLPVYLEEVLITKYMFNYSIVTLTSGGDVDPVNVGGQVVRPAIGEYDENTLLDILISVKSGYKLVRVMRNNEEMIPPRTTYMWNINSNINMEVTFQPASLFFVTTGRKVDLTGTEWQGDLSIDFGDGRGTVSDRLVYEYQDTATSHQVTVQSGDITKFIAKNSGIISVNFESIPGLTVVDLEGNNLTSVDLSTLPNLVSLNVGNNSLSSLDISANPQLTSLVADGNNLTSLNVTAQTKLQTLSAANNNISSIDLSKNTALTSINLYGNNLTSLNYASTLVESLNVSENPITSVTTSASAGALKYFYANSTRFTSISFNNTYSSLLTVSMEACNSLTSVYIVDTPIQTANFDRCENIKSLTINDCDALTSFTYNSLVTEFISFVRNDFTGVPFDISNMSRLTTIDIMDNEITSIGSILPASVITFSCTNNKFTTLPTIQTGSNLEILLCNGNTLTSYDVSKALKLREFDISRNSSLTSNPAVDSGVIPSTVIESINYSSTPIRSITLNGKTALEEVMAEGCNYLSTVNLDDNPALTTISFRQCTNLGSLTADDCVLTSMDVSECTSLTSLSVFGNQLQTADVSDCPNLTELDLGSNKLTSLNVQNNTKLTTLIVETNQLTALDVSTCPALVNLYCQHNQIAALDLTGLNKLNILNCEDNKITSSANLIVSPVLTIAIIGNNSFPTLTIDAHPTLNSLDASESASLNTVFIASCNNLVQIALENSTGLQTLTVTSCGISSLVITQCSSLATMTVTNNKSLQTLDLTGCSSLTTVDVSQNMLTRLDFTSAGTKLKKVVAYENALVYMNFTANTAIEEIEAYENLLPSFEIISSMTTGIVFTTAKYNNLTSLSIDHNEIAGLVTFAPMPALVSVSINNNKITGVYFAADTPMEVFLANDNDIGNTDNGLYDLRSIYNIASTIQSIDLANNPSAKFFIDGEAGALPAGLPSTVDGDYQYPNLESLNINYTATETLNFGYLPKLRRLEAAHSQLATITFIGDGAEVETLPLYILDVSYTPLVGLHLTTSQLVDLSTMLEKSSELFNLAMDGTMGYGIFSNTGFAAGGNPELTNISMRNSTVYSGVQGVSQMFKDLDRLDSLDLTGTTIMSLVSIGVTRRISLQFDGCTSLTELTLTDANSINNYENAKLGGEHVVLRFDGWDFTTLDDQRTSYRDMLMNSSNSAYLTGPGELYYGSNDTVLGDDADASDRTTVMNSLESRGWNLTRVEKQDVNLAITSVTPSNGSSYPQSYNLRVTMNITIDIVSTMAWGGIPFEGTSNLIDPAKCTGTLITFDRDIESITPNVIQNDYSRNLDITVENSNSIRIRTTVVNNTPEDFYETFRNNNCRIITKFVGVDTAVQFIIHWGVQGIPQIQSAASNVPYGSQDSVVKLLYLTAGRTFISSSTDKYYLNLPIYEAWGTKDVAALSYLLEADNDAYWFMSLKSPSQIPGPVCYGVLAAYGSGPLGQQVPWGADFCTESSTQKPTMIGTLGWDTVAASSPVPNDHDYGITSVSSSTQSDMKIFWCNGFIGVLRLVIIRRS